MLTHTVLVILKPSPRHKATIDFLSALVALNQNNVLNREQSQLNRSRVENNILASFGTQRNCDTIVDDDNKQQPATTARYYAKILDSACFIRIVVSTYTQLSRPATMSLAYENRGFAEYPQSTIMDDHPAHDHLHHQQQNRSPPPPISNDDPYYQIDSALQLQIHGLPQQPQKEDLEDSTTSPAATTIQKPLREVLKDEEGRFVCTWVRVVVSSANQLN